MEKRDLYDENKILTGETIYKGQEVPIGRYYITVVVFIQNLNGISAFILLSQGEQQNIKISIKTGHPASGSMTGS